MPAQPLLIEDRSRATGAPAAGAAPFSALVFNSELLHGKVTCRGLAASGFTCDFSYKADEAIRKLEAGRYDLILIDLRRSGATQVGVAAAAIANRNGAKIMAIVAAESMEIVRTLLAYGVDDIVTDDDADIDLLGVKALSLLEIATWRPQHHDEDPNPTPVEELNAITLIEKSLQLKSGSVLERIGDPFSPASMSSCLREAIATCVERARTDRAGIAANRTNRRESDREAVSLSATAIPLGPDGTISSEPFAVIVGDLSMTGARLAHTRPIGHKRIALYWQSVTVPGAPIAVEASIVRCETVGRFYEIGVRFE